MKRGSNQAERLSGVKSPTSSGSHRSSIDWDQVPKLIEDIQFNRSNSHIQSMLATKMMLTTFLRAGSLCRLEWNWFGKELITIPGTTPGLKRRKGKREHIPHLVPITTQMRRMLKKLEQLSGKDKYHFLPDPYYRWYDPWRKLLGATELPNAKAARHASKTGSYPGPMSLRSPACAGS